MSIQKFCILGLARSGTNAICDYLDSYKEIMQFGELFHEHGIYYNLKLKEFLMNVHRRNMMNKVKFMYEFYDFFDELKYIGFKLLISQDKDGLLFNEIKNNNDIKKLCIIRKNSLEQYVSLIVSGLNGIHALTNNDEYKKYIKNKKKAIFNIDHYENFVRQCKNFELNVRKLNNYYIFYYEDLEKKDKYKDLIYNFFDEVKFKKELKTNCIKLNKNIFNSVENGKEIYNYISSKSEFSKETEKWLEENQNNYKE